MRLLIVGPPGAGKGTQATGVADHYGIPAISSGDLFRQHISAQDPLGQKVSNLISHGEFVPDVITSSMIFRRTMEPDAVDGWLLDGYPRTLGQVEALDIALAETNTKLDAIVALVAEPEVLVERMLRRAVEQGRADDNEESIAKRLSIYESETAPILDVYRERGIVDAVDGIGTLDEVFERIVVALTARGIVAG